MSTDDTALSGFNVMRAEILDYVAARTALTVTDANTATVALSVLRDVKDLRDAVEDKRTGIVKPLNEEVKRVNTFAKDIAAPLLAFEARVKGELAAFEDVQRHEREEARRLEMEKQREEREEADRVIRSQQAEADAAIMFGGGEADSEAERKLVEADENRAAMEMQHKRDMREIEAQRVKGASRKWTFEITDEKLVPRELCVPEPKLIRAAIALGLRDAAGLRVFQETKVSIR